MAESLEDIQYKILKCKAELEKETDKATRNVLLQLLVQLREKENLLLRQQTGAAGPDRFVAEQLELLAKLPSASVVGTDIFKHVQKAQKGAAPRINNLRPSKHRSVVPVQLAVPAFQPIITAAWGASEGSALEPEPRELRLAAHLGVCASELYKDEALRVPAIADKLMGGLIEGLGLDLETTTPDTAQCSISCRPHGSSTTLMFVEVKNEVGASGDAGFQGAVYYAHQVRQQPERLAASFCPAVLLEFVGALVRIQGLAYVGGFVVCEPLTPFLNLLDINDRQPEQVLMLARCFRALRHTLLQLVATVEGLAEGAPGPALVAEPEAAAAPLPAQAAAAALAGAPAAAPAQAAAGAIKPWGHCRTPMPHYLHQQVQQGLVQDVCLAAGDRLLYQVSVCGLPRAYHDPGTALVAFKYVRKYGADVHQAWAAEGLAPRLLRYTPLGLGPWHEVVMEWLDPKQGWLPLTAFLLQSHKRGAELNRLRSDKQIPTAFKYTLALAASVLPHQMLALRERVRDVVQRAHRIPILSAEATAGTGKRDLKYGVHGDVRPPNVMLRLPVPAALQAGSAAMGEPGGGTAAAVQGAAAVDKGVSAAKSLEISNLPVAFVDFDWAGVEGEACYPAQLNSTIHWADGTDPGGLIMRQHDLQLLYK